MGVCLATAIVWFATANLSVATPAIVDDLGGPIITLQWANTIFIWLVAVALIALAVALQVRSA
jgi:hypothetical protein